jgi:hypothetical protein
MRTGFIKSDWVAVDSSNWWANMAGKPLEPLGV